jgi:hypothetical protein
VPDSVRFTIQLDEPKAEIHYLLEAVAASRFKVGERVIVKYEERGLKPIWSKRYVREISHVGIAR